MGDCDNLEACCDLCDICCKCFACIGLCWLCCKEKETSRDQNPYIPEMPHGGSYPPHGGAPYPPYAGAPYPPHAGAPYPPYGGAPYPPEESLPPPYDIAVALPPMPPNAPANQLYAKQPPYNPNNNV